MSRIKIIKSTLYKTQFMKLAPNDKKAVKSMEQQFEGDEYDDIKNTIFKTKYWGVFVPSENYDNLVILFEEDKTANIVGLLNIDYWDDDK